MRIILYTAPPSGESLVSRVPTDAEIGPFMTKLFKLVSEVEKRIEHAHYLHWSVWFLTETGKEISANIEVEMTNEKPLPYSAQLMGTPNNGGLIRILEAAASAGLSLNDTGKQIVKQALRIVEELKRQLAAKQ